MNYQAFMAAIEDATINYETSFDLTSFDSGKELKISEIDFVSKQMRISAYAKQISSSQCHRCPKRVSQYQDAFKIRRLKEKVR
jgi:hypothetical protein